jgi:RHS repeat-associated protein
MQYSYSATQNSGQITQAVDTVSGETIAYQYDLLKRLVSASATPTANSPSAAWTEAFQYDGFGNLTQKTLNGTATPIPVNAATNQLTNAYYDANGNMTSGAGVSLTYDASNRAVSASAVSGGQETYEYAPDNKRIHRTVANSTPPVNEWTFYGAAREKLGVYQLVQGTDNYGNAYAYFAPVRTSVWFGGKLVYENGPVNLDRLGTNHAQSAQFLPFGDEITSTSNDRTKFATYTRDSYTGLDYADQRFYASTYGRFMTPDPSAKSAKAGTPGSWNRYSYAQGDPANRKDPRGLDDCSDDPAACGSFFADPYGEDNGVAFDTPSCGLLTIDYIDNQLGEPDDSSCFDSSSSGGGGWGSSPPPPTCSITEYTRGTPRQINGLGQHTYLEVTDSATGLNEVLESGPTNHLNFPNPFGGNWGSMYGYNPPVTNGTFTDPVGTTQISSSTNVASDTGPGSICDMVNALTAAVGNYDSGTLVLYRPVPQKGSGYYNSNSFTFTLLYDVGLVGPSGSGVFPSPQNWTPGWGLIVPGLQP